MVGGTFLYSAELWAPYLDLRKARVPRAYAAWLHGAGKTARADRLIGWVPHRDLDIKAEAAVVRMLADAQTHGGLIIAPASAEPASAELGGSVQAGAEADGEGSLVGADAEDGAADVGAVRRADVAGGGVQRPT